VDRVGPQAGVLPEGLDSRSKKDIFPQASHRPIAEILMKIHGGLTRRDILKATGIAVSVLPFSARIAGAADDRKLRIGIIGSGHVGSALGGAWARAGNEVMFSSRNLDEDKKLAAQIGANARAGTPQQAVAFGQVLLFAVPYSAFPELAKSLSGSVKGKVVINASNPFPQRDGEVASQALAKGAGLFDAQLLPGAFVVRAFNAVPAARMASAHEDPGRIGMPVAGDKRAMELATRLIREVGYEPVVVGGLDMAKYCLPGSPLSGEHTPDEIRSIAATLKP
jgi:8-hydroxy-5-deazaflavin:NADPH oxidoreductase